MRVLVACEWSGEVRRAFREKGHEAFSCDLLPSEDDSSFHLQGDVRDVLAQHWDLVIAHPPCDHLAVSGAKWFREKRLDGRQQAAIAFFMQFVNAAPKVCIENPVGVMSTYYRKPDQIVQPYWFGDPFTKTTCLWLSGLPLLIPTQMVEKGARTITRSGRSLPTWYNLPPSPDRARLRGRTFTGFARAMASQWG